MPTTRTSGDLSVTTAEHPNALRMRESFAAFARGDLETVRQNMTADVVWTNAGTSPLAGTHRGWDEVLAMFVRLTEITEGTFGIDLVSVLADDLHSVAIYDSTATIQGVTGTDRTVLVDELDANGKVRAVHLMAYDQATADARLSG